ncbi:MAG: hypothetical protein H6622_05020 [Halobacteriovoraceae bacterium]|nr:hypothetical protein [Halobacteriovoraceae bacterium]
MSYRLDILGEASGRTLLQIDLDSYSPQKDLLSLLQELKFPIASSCEGEGICKKCVVNGNLLTCQVSLELIKSMGLDRIKISYL